LPQLYKKSNDAVGNKGLYVRGHQLTAFVPRLEHIAISNGTHKLQVLYIRFVIIHTRGRLTFEIVRNTYIFGTLNDLKL